ncbi:glycoside hydrolase family 65 protein [Thermomonospora cellulosilytica]|uniref:Trehalose/maltose hydrolase-like predicted phosphorylase n=1 Tax=Thermomonospora cellulosilytica TaxID=1411118 RepID=A0A7W3MVP8_9ACTN|nr:glycoside hydrolase family 65 protein [Thermomonospora cellulosilytica]MBA9002771.1 trehalose/maltose hydrolase-like predicted phosphorylase [Thermomonospora cellulosilytica]
MSRWVLSYDGYDPAAEGVREALCTLGNGYFATRGSAPESSADGVHYPGTYITGCYDRLVSEVAGRAVDNEDLVNTPDWTALTFRVAEGSWFSVDAAAEAGRLLSYRQELDMKRGVLTRFVRFRDEAGHRTRVTQRRLVSMDEPHLAAMETIIVPENWSARLHVRCPLDGRVANRGVTRYRDLEGRHLTVDGLTRHGDDILCLRTTTRTSRIGIATAVRVRTSPEAGRVTHTENDHGVQEMFLDCVQGVPVTVEKTAAIATSRDHAIEECRIAAARWARRAGPFDDLVERHVLAWDQVWRRCQISVDVEDAQRILNLHMFHLLQTVSEHTVDLDAGVPARGLHGEAYRGHVFWDELFILPFLNMRFPEIARALLMYRWRRLPEARWAARQAGHRGAMYPWQSGSDGREETQRLHLNPRSGRWLPDHSHLQRHVGLAVAHNVWRFHEATGDIEFLAEYGAEMLLEIARCFADLAAYDRAADRYEIRGVVGPDEYHDGYPDRAEPGLDNNAYTNVMTAWVLCRALDALALLPEDRRTELRERLALTREEIERFDDVSRKLKVPFHDDVISQFDGYERLAELDWDRYRAVYGDIRRLDRILEAENDTVNRYKVSKQADVLMLFYLLSPEELDTILTRLGHRCDADLIDRTIGYYLPRTCDGSSLSALVRAWILARVDGEDAWRTFLDTLHGDIADSRRGTTAEGIHLGAMAGSVDLVQRCYAGITTRGDVLHLDPRLPPAVTSLSLGLRYRGHWGIDLTCRHDRLRVQLRPGAASPVQIAYRGRVVTIEPGSFWETEVRADPAGSPRPDSARGAASRGRPTPGAGR